MPQKNDKTFNRDLRLNEDLIRSVAAAGGNSTAVYDGNDRQRMIDILRSSGYTVVTLGTSSTIRVEW